MTSEKEPSSRLARGGFAGGQGERSKSTYFTPSRAINAHVFWALLAFSLVLGLLQILTADRGQIVEREAASVHELKDLQHGRRDFFLRQHFARLRRKRWVSASLIRSVTNVAFLN
jgi:hypothetical protein